MTNPQWLSLIAALVACGSGSELAAAHKYDSPTSAVSPDHRWQASIRVEPGPIGASGNPPSSLWLTDRQSGKSHLLFRGKTSDDPKHDTRSLSAPDFSLDGGYIYVEADAYAVSPAIHQINRETGEERLVTDGGLIGILRNGPWRGLLIVSQHRYHPEGGSYDAVSLYYPDGRLKMAIPGSMKLGEKAVAPWLHGHGWRAN